MPRRLAATSLLLSLLAAGAPSLARVNGKSLFQAEDRTFCRMVIRGYVDPAHAPGGMAPHPLGRT